LKSEPGGNNPASDAFFTVTQGILRGDDTLVRSNYRFEKRQKELARKKKKEEKKQRRLEKTIEISGEKEHSPQAESEEE
jgi:hypothetical protein